MARPRPKNARGPGQIAVAWSAQPSCRSSSDTAPIVSRCERKRPLGSCPNAYCNLCDAQGRCYCAAVCTSAAMCGGATCDAFARRNGSCSASQTACSPR